jgi:hypothetical protein
LPSKAARQKIAAFKECLFLRHLSSTGVYISVRKQYLFLSPLVKMIFFPPLVPCCFSTPILAFLPYSSLFCIYFTLLLPLFSFSFPFLPFSFPFLPFPFTFSPFFSSPLPIFSPECHRLIFPPPGGVSNICSSMYCIEVIAPCAFDSEHTSDL